MTDRHGPSSPGCRQIFERLSEYIDGELPDDLCERIDGHMADCAPCHRFLESLRRTVKLVEQADAPPMPDEIRRSLREAWAACRKGGKDS